MISELFRKVGIWWFGGMVVWLALQPVHQASARTGQAVVILSAGSHRLRAEVSSTLESRDIGLMGKRVLPENQGMLFVFPEERRHCMWMRGTSIPLSVAFIDNRGIIVNIADMKPQTDDFHCAARPVRYALETNQGWFQKRGLLPGLRVRGLEKAPRGE